MKQLAQTNWRPMDTLFNVGTVCGLTDRELLDRFRDGPGAAGQEAFRALVARHGPMVLELFVAACARIRHDAEDAFLVLVLKGQVDLDPRFGSG